MRHLKKYETYKKLRIGDKLVYKTMEEAIAAKNSAKTKNDEDFAEQHIQYFLDKEQHELGSYEDEYEDWGEDE